MIRNINKIKNFGLFKDFSWSSYIPNFSQLNLIYGWNYSGKTTLSRIFRCIELRTLHDDFQNAEFELIDDQNNTISHSRLRDVSNRVRVFNTDFVEENLHWSSQEAEPLFILGKKDAELQTQIELIKQEIINLSDENRKIEMNISDLDSVLENNLTNKARDLDRIKPPYDKRKLKISLENVKSDPGKYFLGNRAVQNLLETLKASPKDNLSEISIEILPQNKIAEIELTLNKTVVSGIIERLKNDPLLNDWIKKGVILHKGKDMCEFCGGQLKPNLINTYEKHFSEEYESLMRALNILIVEVEKYKISIIFPDEKRINPQLETRYRDLKNTFQNNIEEYNKNITILIELLRKKISNPFMKLAEDSVCPNDNTTYEALKKINEILKEHNTINDNFKNEQEIAFEKLELHYACEFNEENKYFDNISLLEDLKNKKENNIKNIMIKEAKKDEIETQISDIAKAADKINQYLSSMFGKEHIKINATDKNKFKILRDGFEAKNLSSGEKTAIAFSYFLTHLEDKDTDISKAIVFIDDPISSLDSNHLYNTFAVIQAKLSNCHQLIISTHNHEFFNLIKEWLKKVQGHKEKCCFYLNERITKNGEEISVIRVLPGVLLNFKSEYHFLFSRIKSFANNSCTDYESLYQLPNIIRRFLEAFLGFKYSAGLGGLKKIIDNECDCIKVERFINEFSHQNDMNRSLRFCDSNECSAIVDIILKALQKRDSEHYQTLEENYKNVNVPQTP